MAETLVSTDIVEAPDALNDGETWVRADLGRMDEIGPVMEGAEMVVHFGGIADESTWGDILHSNIIGTYNVYEAAFQAGARRVVYASSIHAMGMYPKTEFVALDAPHRPDTYYGLSKCFAEDLARLYWEKRQMESVCVRILSASGTPQNARALGSFLSNDDLVQLVTRSMDSPVTGFTLIWGVSNNDRAPVDNRQAAYLGYRPTFNAEDVAPEILARTPAIDPTDPQHSCQGGPFAIVPLGESGVAMIKKMSESN
jgi:uronate dehydrogenase